MGNFFKDIFGISAYQNRKEAKAIKTSAEEKYEAATKDINRVKTHLNDCINDFGKLRCKALKNTIGVFLSYLKEIDQKNKLKEYEILTACDISERFVQELETIDMNASQLLVTTATSAAIGAAALTGVPALVTSGVGALATASTGTAISTLAGAAKTNAILAWLGGGSLAAGGGGMAAGAALLSTLTYTATGGLALMAAGLIASKHYEKKLTQAKDYEAQVDLACAQLETAKAFMHSIEKRIEEMSKVTTELEDRCLYLLHRFEPFVSDFDLKHEFQISQFQNAAIAIKAMSDLGQTKILSEDGTSLSESSMEMIVKTKRILNTSL